jgi:RNA polymerase sigma-70 factor (ECF subfamily)
LAFADQRVVTPPVHAAHDAFVATVLPVLPSIRRVALALTHDDTEADDLVQETCLRAFRGWHTYRQGEDVRRWLATICRNAYRALGKRHAARDGATVSLDDPDVDGMLAVDAHRTAQRLNVEDLFSRQEVRDAIHGALAALDPAFRAVVLLVDLEGYSYDDAAAMLGLPVGTVRSRLYRARHRLQLTLIDLAADLGYGTSTLRPTTR